MNMCECNAHKGKFDIFFCLSVLEANHVEKASQHWDSFQIKPSMHKQKVHS